MIFFKQLIVLSVIFLGANLNGMGEEQTYDFHIEASKETYDNRSHYDYLNQTDSNITLVSGAFDTSSVGEISDNAPQENSYINEQQRDLAEYHARETIAEKAHDAHYTEDIQKSTHNTENSQQYFAQTDVSLQVNVIVQTPLIKAAEDLTKNVKSPTYRANLVDQIMSLKTEQQKQSIRDSLFSNVQKQIDFLDALLDGTIDQMIATIQKGDLSEAKKTYAQLEKMWPWDHKESFLYDQHTSGSREFIEFIGSDIMQTAEGSLVSRKDYLESYDKSFFTDKLTRYQKLILSKQLQGDMSFLQKETYILSSRLFNNPKSSSCPLEKAMLVTLYAVLTNPITKIFSTIKNANFDVSTKTLGNFQMQCLWHFEGETYKTMEEASADMIERHGVDLLAMANKCFKSRPDYQAKMEVSLKSGVLLQKYIKNPDKHIVAQQDRNTSIFNERKDALSFVAKNPTAYREQSFTLSPAACDLLQTYGLNQNQFTYCIGNEVQHQLYSEFAKLLNEVAEMPSDELRDMVITYTSVGNVCTQQSNIEKAFSLADCAWAALDCAKVISESGINTVIRNIPEIAEGIVDGCIKAVCFIPNMTLYAVDKVIHPVQTVQDVRNAFTHLGTCLLNLADSFDVPGELPLEFTPEAFDAYIQQGLGMHMEKFKENMNSVIEAASQITVKNATSCVVETYLTSKILSLGINFIKNYARPSATQLAKIAQAVKDKVAAKAQKLADKLGPERIAITPDGTKIAVNTQKEAQVLQQSMDKAKGSDFSQKSKSKASNINATQQAQQRFHNNKPLLEQLDKKIEELAKTTRKDCIGKILDKTHVTKLAELDNKTEKFYNVMRESAEDIRAISKNTGLPIETIEKIKNHVFIEEHILREGRGRFFPDADMAAAWQRLIDNNYVYSDLKMLQHEYAEALIMRGLEITYDEAHYIVNEIYNWDRLL